MQLLSAWRQARQEFSDAFLCPRHRTFLPDLEFYARPMRDPCSVCYRADPSHLTVKLQTSCIPIRLKVSVGTETEAWEFLPCRSRTC